MTSVLSNKTTLFRIFVLMKLLKFNANLTACIYPSLGTLLPIRNHSETLHVTVVISIISIETRIPSPLKTQTIDVPGLGRQLLDFPH